MPAIPRVDVPACAFRGLSQIAVVACRKELVRLGRGSKTGPTHEAASDPAPLTSMIVKDPARSAARLLNFTSKRPTWNSCMSHAIASIVEQRSLVTMAVRPAAADARGAHRRDPDHFTRFRNPLRVGAAQASPGTLNAARSRIRIDQLLHGPQAVAHHLRK